MSSDGISLVEGIGSGAGREAYAPTDEQILGVEPEEEVAGDRRPATSEKKRELNTKTQRTRSSEGTRTHPDGIDGSRSGYGEPAQPGMAVPLEPPKWLAREMNDPWVGDEARELWEGVQRAQREAAAFREVIGTPEDARALREIYPGGLAEARNAAERARELAEIDATIFGVPGRGMGELRAGRTQLVERLYAQDPGAFREMVEAGIRLLEGGANGRKVASGDWRVTSGREEKPTQSTQVATTQAASQDSETMPRSLHSGQQRTLAYGRDDSALHAAHEGQVVAPEVASRYREFERVANAELERSVGGAIGRALDEALPNLRSTQNSGITGGIERQGQAHALQERLQAAVEEEVEASLRNDAGLGEQVARILSGRRFDDEARAQVVRLIDARARQLVPGAVKRVVGSWTTATLGSGRAEGRELERKSITLGRSAHEARSTNRNEQKRLTETAGTPARGKVDYRKWSDDQILEM